MTFRLLLSAAVVLLASGCDSTTALDGPPAPLAVAAFDLGDDGFPDDNARSAGASAGENYANAAVRVGVVTAVVGLNLALPSAATRAVTRDTPEAVDGVWIWETEENVLGTPVALRLEAEPDGSEIDWRLTSQRLGDQAGAPFTYYTATTGIDGRTGSWRLFNPDADGAVLRADFDVRDADDREITFAVPDGQENGGTSVRYATDGADQSFDFRDAEGERALIRWDLDTRAGSIRAAAFNGGDRACWNSNLRNVAC